MDNFMAKVSELYNKLLEPKNSIYKIKDIDECKISLGIQLNETFGERYYKLAGTMKITGSVYTPDYIAKYMIENTIKEEDIIKNPYLKIVDPSCGVGNIIIPCFNYLKKLFINNLDTINKKNSLHLTPEVVDWHIVEYNLYGIDIDANVLEILQIDLFNISGYINSINYFHEDFLEKNLITDFDIYIGNPPYIGHKSIDSIYKTNVLSEYKTIYKDKSDISYCFFYKAIKNIKALGKITFITSRYFMESLSGKAIRDFIFSNSNINKIIDFYGIRPFRYAGIDPVIIFIEPYNDNRIEIEVFKAKNTREINFKDNDFEKILQTESFNNFFINRNQLGSNTWIVVNEDKRRILKKLQEHCTTQLSDICDSYQGIITGCDKAFILDKENIEKYKIEKALLKPWIKSSHIHKELVSSSQEYIIYSNMITNEYSYPQAVAYISMYKQKLLKRRECSRGLRKWYELQWGRKTDIFDDLKIIYPYKANCNRFALDKGSYFSADIYALKLKDTINFNYDFIVKLLNSKIYDFYFKAFAKKLGGNLYEYYPNNLMRLRVPNIDIGIDIDEDFLYDYFNISDYERKIIEEA